MELCKALLTFIYQANGYKNAYMPENPPRSTVMAIIKQCKITVAVMNLPKGTSIFCSHTQFRRPLQRHEFLLGSSWGIQGGCKKSPKSLLAWRMCLNVDLDTWCSYFV